MHSAGTARLASRGFAVVFVAVVAMMSLEVAAGATGAAPQLSITVSNGQSAVSAGDKLSYTIVVKNLGETRVKNLRITQTLPPGLVLRSADQNGRAAKDQVLWKVDLAASDEATLHTTTSLGKTSTDILRLASVACASESLKAPPIVCATQSNQLPAGAKADQKDADAPDGGQSIPIWAVAAGLLVLIAVAGVLVKRRRGRHISRESNTSPDAGAR